MKKIIMSASFGALLLAGSAAMAFAAPAASPAHSSAATSTLSSTTSDPAPLEPAPYRGVQTIQGDPVVTYSPSVIGTGTISHLDATTGVASLLNSEGGGR